MNRLNNRCCSYWLGTVIRVHSIYALQRLSQSSNLTRIITGTALDSEHFLLPWSEFVVGLGIFCQFRTGRNTAPRAHDEILTLTGLLCAAQISYNSHRFGPLKASCRPEPTGDTFIGPPIWARTFGQDPAKTICKVAVAAPSATVQSNIPRLRILPLCWKRKSVCFPHAGILFLSSSTVDSVDRR